MYIFHKSVSLNHHVCKFIISFALIKQGRSENIDNEIKQNLYSYIELLLSHFVVWAFNINLDKENYKIEMYNNLLNTTETFGMFLVYWILWPITICSFLGVSLFSKIYKYIKKRREIK